jgi:hypothetical protein
MTPHPSEPAAASVPACRDADPALFFPRAAGMEDTRVIAAKHLCRGCPIRQSCLAGALRFSENEGIWGGFTTRERQRLREHALRLRSLDPRLVTAVLAGRPVAVPGRYRPALVHRLLAAGWEEERVGTLLGLTPLALRSARAVGEDAALFAAAEDEARDRRETAA